MALPQSLSINAWTGKRAPASPLGANPLGWGLKRRTAGLAPKEATTLAPAPLADLRDWKHPEVGWGLVLPDNPALAEKDRALAVDAPPPIQRLVAARGNAPVYRYTPKGEEGYLRRYRPDGGKSDLAWTTNVGTGPNQLPQYLLIHAGPESIPWRFQYSANMSRFVGRLDLQGDALEHYVDALLDDWSTAACDRRAPLSWSVNHGVGDITYLMHAALSRKLWENFHSDTDLTAARCLHGQDATVGELLNVVADIHPALIVTTSHGMTGPPEDPAAFVDKLGVLVDVGHQTLSPLEAVKAAPEGAIWYAHACCSAGSDAASRYVDLCASNADVQKVLSDVATISGTRIAPLPQALLGVDKPIRAFIGHVEPTFDWTLQDPYTLQPLAHTLQAALYKVLFQADRRTPIGYALSKVFDEAGQFLGQYLQSVEKSGNGIDGAAERALYQQLVAMDRQGTVILGDPTVSLPDFRPSR